MPTVISGTTLNALTTVSWGVMSLFSNNEAGVWFDPSDMSTMFQDSTGIVPVTAMEQPVGLILDKSKGLTVGNELVVSGTAPWLRGFLSVDGTISSTSNSVTITQGANDSSSFRWVQPITCVVGRTYRLSVGTVSRSGGTGSVIGFTSSSSGTGMVATNSVVDNQAPVTWYVVATATTMYLTITLAGGVTGTTATFNNLSVRELPGNHASQSTSTSRPVLSARYNLLTKSEQFNDAAWGVSTVAITPNITTSPTGTNTAVMWQNSATFYPSVFQSSVPVTGGVRYTFIIYAKAGNRDIVSLELRFGVSDDALVDATYNLTTNTSTVFSTGAEASIVDVGSGWRRLTLSKTNPSTGITCIAIIGGSDLNSGDMPSLGLNFYIWGADLRVANDGVNLPPYQRVNTATDYDANGFPAYLLFDGVDDQLVSSSVNMTASDNMTLGLALRKLRDTTFQVPIELGFTNTDNFGFRTAAPSTNPGTLSFSSKGTSIASAGSPSASNLYPAPVTAIMLGLADISEDIAILRVNGIEIAQSSVDQGTGNYGNYPIYLGRRASGFNQYFGRIYNAIVLDRRVNNYEMLNIEMWLNGRTKTY